MGSFDVACGLSNLPIHYQDPAGLVLLSKSSSSSLGNFGLFTSEVTTEFLPYLPPVFGLYDDYGRLADIETSATAQFLTERFNLPAHAVLQCIGNYGRNIHSRFGPIAEYYDNTLPERTPQFNESWKGYLEDLGFQMTSDHEFTFGGCSLILNESSFLIKKPIREHVLEQTGRKVYLEEILQQFVDFTQMVPGYASEDYARIIQLHSLSGMFLHKTVYNAMMSDQENPDFTEEDLRKLFVKQDDLSTLFPENHFVEFFLRELGWRNMSAFINYDSMAKELVDLSKLTDLLKQVNRYYHPTVCGSQHGDDETSLRLAEVTAKILAENLSQMDW